MSNVAWFFGFLFAVAIGTVATAATAAELQQEVASWANGTRWRFYKRPGSWHKANLLKTILGVHTIEILFVLGVVWVVGLIVALVANKLHPYHYYAVGYIFGSLVGAAAAPWLWLHFARTFAPARPEKKQAVDFGADATASDTPSSTNGAIGPAKADIPKPAPTEMGPTVAPAAESAASGPEIKQGAEPHPEVNVDGTPAQTKAAVSAAVVGSLKLARGQTYAEVALTTPNPNFPPAPPPVGDAESKGNDSSDENIEFAPYRFMTYLLAAAILVALLQPYLPVWLSRVQKVGALSVEVTLSQGRNDRGASLQNVPSAGQSNQGKDTADRLSTTTLRAYQAGTGLLHDGIPTALQHVNTDMQGFADLSLVDRDKVYIAYFYRERNARRGGNMSNAGIYDPPIERYSNLYQYVENVRSLYHGSRDENLLDDLAHLSTCVSFYAKELRDFRLFLIDSERLIRPLLFQVAAQWSKKEGSSAPLNLAEAEEVLVHISDGLHLRGRDSEKRVCQQAIEDVRKPIELSGVGVTPYPAYFVAHYLAAIDSVESGVLVMTDWLQKQRKGQTDGTIPRDPEQDWYAVRAMLTASQLPYSFGGITPTHRAQVQFQEQTTDRIGQLIGLGGARSWRSLCDRLQRPGLHTLVGRHLAFTYADERNYLFEILGPEDFGIPRADLALKSTDTSPLTFLEEAEAILERPECFAGVARFSGERKRLTGQYHLNAAYLLYWIRSSADGSEKTELTRKIRQHLERAKELGHDENDRNSLDLLRRGDDYEQHRIRLARLIKVLDREDEKE